jgi:hypothetical protein
MPSPFPVGFNLQAIYYISFFAREGDHLREEEIESQSVRIDYANSRDSHQTALAVPSLLPFF